MRLNKSTCELFSVILLFLFSACAKEKKIWDDATPVETIIPLGDEAYLVENSDFIFNQDSLFTIHLIIPPVNYELLNADPAAEKYYEGQLVFRGDTVSPVGIRYKGSIGAFAGCLSGLDVANPSGRKTCTKLSMKVKINWIDEDKTFYGLKKLQFHSMNHDKTQMHERFGFWLFRQMGVMAPRSVHVKLMINGEYSGLYALTEHIDACFAGYHFEDGSGNLYKEVWPINQNGRPFWENVYLDHLVTNNINYPSATRMKNFAADIADASDEEIHKVIENWMNISHIIAYAAVDRTIRADDGPFHWYEHRGRIYNHNYFWYEEPTLNKLYLIPCDLDNAFENILFDKNDITAIADAWGEKCANCEAFPYGPQERKQRSAACDKLTGGWASYTDEYANYQKALINGPLSAAIADSLLNQWEKQITEASIEASLIHKDALRPVKWEMAMEDLRECIDFAREH